VLLALIVTTNSATVTALATSCVFIDEKSAVFGIRECGLSSVVILTTCLNGTLCGRQLNTAITLDDPHLDVTAAADASCWTRHLTLPLHRWHFERRLGCLVKTVERLLGRH